jgi:hypothetical protein
MMRENSKCSICFLIYITKKHIDILSKPCKGNVVVIDKCCKWISVYILDSIPFFLLPFYCYS